MELINIKTGEISHNNFFSLHANSVKNEYGESSHIFPIMFLSETNEKNEYLLGFFIRINIEFEKFASNGIYLFLFNFITSNKTSVINIDSINIIREHAVYSDFSEHSKASCIQTKSGYFILTAVDLNNQLVSLALDSRISENITSIVTNIVIPNTFLKRVFLKDEKSILIYITYSEEQVFLGICIQDYKLKEFFNLIHEGFPIEITDGIFYYSMDAIALSENRVIILSQQMHGRMLIINIFDFFDEYRKFFRIKYNIKLINQKMHVNYRYSLIFKYKDTLGLHFENMIGQNGFVIFGYFNSSDPKQIYNIKKDGLEYNIKLNQYLFLQSNIFGYEIKGIKIIAIPETNSGLFFISNITKKELKLNEIIDYNTEITLNFNRDIIHKGKYLFKFAGVLEEPNLDKVFEYSDGIKTKENLDVVLDKYKEFYENNRNKNIIGKAALVQINILANIQIFCDEKKDETCLKSNNIMFDLWRRKIL